MAYASASPFTARASAWEKQNIGFKKMPNWQKDISKNCLYNWQKNTRCSDEDWPQPGHIKELPIELTKNVQMKIDLSFCLQHRSALFCFRDLFQSVFLGLGWRSDLVNENIKSCMSLFGFLFVLNLHRVSYFVFKKRLTLLFSSFSFLWISCSWIAICCSLSTTFTFKSYIWIILAKKIPTTFTFKSF